MNLPDSPLNNKTTPKQKGKLIVIEGIDGSGKTVQTQLLVKRLQKEGCQVQMTDFPQYGKSFFANMIEKYLRGGFGWPQELKDHLKKYPLSMERGCVSKKSTTEYPANNTSIEGVGSVPDEVNPYLSSLLYAGDRWEMKEQMNKWLVEGNIIISNRYVCSNMAHQGAKIRNDEERNKFFEWLEILEYEKYAIPKPDLNIYLHVPTKVSQKLIKHKVQEEQGFKSVIDVHEKDVSYLERVQNVYLDLSEKYSSWHAVECFRDNKMLSKEEISEKVWNIADKY